MSQTVDLINTGAGQQQRRVVTDLKRAITQLVDATGSKGIRWVEAIKKLEEQSSVRVENAEFAEVIKSLEVTSFSFLFQLSKGIAKRKD